MSTGAQAIARPVTLVLWSGLLMFGCYSAQGPDDVPRMDSGPDLGVELDVPPDDGGVDATVSSDDGAPPDAFIDPCATAGTTCDMCNQRAGCGFCFSTGECRSDGLRGDCADWRDGRAECIDCTERYTDCATCMLDGLCGWCASSSTCLTAAIGGLPPAVPGCSDWHFVEIDYCTP